MTTLSHPQSRLRRPSQDLHVIGHSKRHCRVSSADIQATANSIFEAKGRGITYLDLIQGRSKVVDTKKQAQKLLRNHKTRGTLYTNSSMTIPQQYFLSKEDAEEAALKYNSLSHPDPTGVSTKGSTNKHLYTPMTHSEIAIEDKKADSITEAIELIAQDTSGALPVGLHNIRISLQLPPEYTEEVYNERLSHVPTATTRERSKRIATKIDGFNVDVFFYPNKNTKTVIIVSCSDRPFPISLNSPERLTSDFISFVAQIRGFICRHLSDSRGLIVPPIHNSRCWRLAHADINWDIRVTTLQYLGMDGFQITKVNDVIQRIYRKRINGNHFIRIEEGVHAFPADNSMIDNSIGQTLVQAANEARWRIIINSHDQ